MGERRRTYLIQDPYDDDAVQFIRTIFTSAGLRPLCFYTDRKARYYGEQQYPILTGNLVEAAVDVSIDDLGAFASWVGARYDVAGIVPYREDTVDVAADLLEHLDVAWNEPSTLRLFRDKAAMREALRARDETMRVASSRRVSTVEEVFAHPLPERFVIKPNDGFGNTAVGVFEPPDRAGVARHLADHLTTDGWLLEEFVDGTEYSCNGQVRHDGSVLVHGVFRYDRLEVNDYPTVYAAEVQVHTDDPHFGPVTDYATRLLGLTGLRGCPFHLEVKVDESGPCLIDLGARLPSEGGGNQLSQMHPDRADVHAIAAHDYLGPNTFAVEPTDWARYDERTTILVYGVSTEAGTVATLAGVDAVEAMPEFVNWVIEPRVGDVLVKTRDLRGAPYLAVLRHAEGQSSTDRLIAEVRSLVRWNVGATRAARARARVLRAFTRGRRKLRWMAARWTPGGQGR